MPLIKPRQNRVPMVRHISRLQEPNREVLFAYAKFIGDTPDWVLNQLIESTLAKERDFMEWRKVQPPADTPARPQSRRRDAATGTDETM
jgi:hypothetical protein